MAALNVPQKNSILKRPIRKSAGRANKESADKQWQLEQEKLERLKTKRQQLAQTRGTMLFGSKQEKAEIYGQDKDSIAEHYRLKQLQQQHEREQDIHIAQQMQQHYQALNQTEMAQKEARKYYNQQLLDENQRLLQYRQQLRKQQKEQDVQHERHLSQEYDERWRQNPL